MSFQQGLSGLNASSKNLEVIGPTTSPTPTPSARSRRGRVCRHVCQRARRQQHRHRREPASRDPSSSRNGNITTTSSPLDLAINGNGFFEVNNGSQTLLHAQRPVPGHQGRLDSSPDRRPGRLVRLPGRRSRTARSSPAPARFRCNCRLGRGSETRPARSPPDMNLDARKATTLPAGNAQINFSRRHHLQQRDLGARSYRPKGQDRGS